MEPFCRQQYYTQPSLCISWENVCGQYHEQTLVSEVFPSQQQTKVIAILAFENVTQFRTEDCRTGSFLICEVNLNFLPSARHFDCDRKFCAMVSVLNVRVHTFHNIGNWRVEIGFQVIISWRVWSVCVKKHKFSHGATMGRLFLKLQPPLAPPDSNAPAKECKGPTLL